VGDFAISINAVLLGKAVTHLKDDISARGRIGITFCLACIKWNVQEETKKLSLFLIYKNRNHQIVFM
jgi:hypothetical protein